MESGRWLLNRERRAVGGESRRSQERRKRGDSSGTGRKPEGLGRNRSPPQSGHPYACNRLCHAPGAATRRGPGSGLGREWCMGGVYRPAGSSQASGTYTVL